mgnify:FL=1
MTVRIALEAPDQAPAIRALLLQAFPTALEADLVDRLRHDGDVAIGVVAVEADAVVGYAVFSPMTAPMKALGLGPVAVKPARQRRGIGGMLIQNGVQRAKEAGWDAVFVLGDSAYYSRFGFDAAQASGFDSPYAGPHFMALPLKNDTMPSRSGRVDYAAAFRDLE